MVSGYRLLMDVNNTRGIAKPLPTVYIYFYTFFSTLLNSFHKFKKKIFCKISIVCHHFWQRKSIDNNRTPTPVVGSLGMGSVFQLCDHLSIEANGVCVRS